MKTFDSYLRGMLVTEEGRRFAAYPDLVKTSLPPSVAAAVLTAAMVIVAVLHELAHNTAPAATAPADPASPKESP